MKRIKILLLATLCFSTLAACNETTPTIPTTPTTEVNTQNALVIAPEVETEVAIDTDVSVEIPSNEFVVPDYYSHLDPIIASVFCSVQNMPDYQYIPNMPLDEVILSEIYGITPDFYTDFYGEIPELGHEEDRLLFFRTDDTEKLKQQLEDYLVSQETLNVIYPTYSDKFLIREINIFDNYVYLNMLSSYPDDDLWLDSAETLEWCKETLVRVSTEIDRVLNGGIPNPPLDN